MINTYLLLGSNEGDRMNWINQAIDRLRNSCGPVVARSSVYETAAWGITDQPAFLNMIIVINTTKSPFELLAQIHSIESALGRQREVKWGQRTLDIDILFFGDIILESPELTIPHPFLHERRFTLVPLAEIAPEFRHPKLHKSVNDLLSACPDPLIVNKYSLTSS